MKYLVITLAALALAGCETISGAVEQARTFSAAAVGNALQGECSLSTGQRAKNLAAINAYMESHGLVSRAVPQDCDGDGKPDAL